MAKFSLFFRCLALAVASLLSLFAAPALAQITHPMDALTGKEVARAVAALKAAGRADDSTRFAIVTLKEMAKSDVLAWKPGQPISRAAIVVLRHKRRTYEATIDLDRGKIVEITEKPGAQPNIILDEWILAGRLTKNDRRWRAAMKKRGIAINDQIVCTPISAGDTGDSRHKGRRILNVSCYQYGTKTSHLYGRSISGLFAVVDVEAKKVIEVVDTGAVVAPPEPDAERALRPALKPVQFTSPDGKNVQLSGSIQATWQNWSFHLRMDRRAGLIVSLVQFADQGVQRLVAYQMSLSEIYVPYMEPSREWASRTFLDAGEFGVGFQMSTLMPGADCPEQATYITTVIPNDKGKVFPVRRAICIFERPTGGPAWRHGNPARPTGLTRPAIDLVVRTIATLGNYDYIFDWV
ncbi:MAG: copper amine oxidase, partial [Alphaproteobacteria bacterium]